MIIKGIFLAVYITLGIISFALSTRRRNPLIFLALIGIFCLSVLQATRLMLPEHQPTIVVTAPPPIEVQEQVVAVNASWALVSPSVARWQPHVLQAAQACDLGQVTGDYDAGLLIAAIITQESGGDPTAVGGAWDTGLTQVVPRENPNPVFRNRPTQVELLDPQFNLNFAACLLRGNIVRLGDVVAGIDAYNGNGIHGGKTYATIILDHYRSFIPQAVVAQSQAALSAPLTKFLSAPVAGPYLITQGYGAGHPGLDIGRFETVTAAMDAVVKYVGPLYKSANGHYQCVAAGCLGRYAIVLDHGGGTFTVYGHNSCSYVQAGETVRAGQPIACIGSEGKSTGPHLHFELRINETWSDTPAWPWQGSYASAIDPTSYLP